MGLFVESLRRLYLNGDISLDKISNLYASGKISIDEMDYILKHADL